MLAGISNEEVDDCVEVLTVLSSQQLISDAELEMLKRTYKCRDKKHTCDNDVCKKMMELFKISLLTLKTLIIVFKGLTHLQRLNQCFMIEREEIQSITSQRLYALMLLHAHASQCKKGHRCRVHLCKAFNSSFDRTNKRVSATIKLFEADEDDMEVDDSSPN